MKSVVGLDTAKNVFQLHRVDRDGKLTFKKRLRRVQVTDFFVNLPQLRDRVGSNPGRSSLGSCSGNVRAYCALGCPKVCKAVSLVPKERC